MFNWEGYRCFFYLLNIKLKVVVIVGVCVLLKMCWFFVFFKYFDVFEIIILKN